MQFITFCDNTLVWTLVCQKRHFSQISYAWNFYLVPCRMYQDKLLQLKKQLQMLKDGTLPEYVKKTKKIQQHYQERQRQNEAWRDLEVLSKNFCLSLIYESVGLCERCAVVQHKCICTKWLWNTCVWQVSQYPCSWHPTFEMNSDFPYHVFDMGLLLFLNSIWVTYGSW